MFYRLIGLTLLLTTLGCEVSLTKPKLKEEAAKKPAGPKVMTKEDARRHMQHEIDRFLGGAKTAKLALQAGFPIEAQLDPENVLSIDITNVLDAYSENGEIIKETFKIDLITTLKAPLTSRGKAVIHNQALLFYLPHKRRWSVTG
jgi:hypothetical protein